MDQRQSCLFLYEISLSQREPPLSHKDLYPQWIIQTGDFLGRDIKKWQHALTPLTEEQGVTAAVALLLKRVNEDFAVLFVRRVINPKDPWSGQIGLPGGKRDLKDTTLKDTIMREVREEVDIDLTEKCQFLGVLPALISPPRPEMKILPFVILLENEPAVTLNEKELEDFVWITLKELSRNRGTVTFWFGEFPSYNVGHHVIWGLTYRILEMFLQTLWVQEPSTAHNCEEASFSTESWHVFEKNEHCTPLIKYVSKKSKQIQKGYVLGLKEICDFFGYLCADFNPSSLTQEDYNKFLHENKKKSKTTLNFYSRIFGVISRVYDLNLRIEMLKETTSLKDSEIEERLEKAKETLKEHGYLCEVSAREVKKYLQADTYYETLSMDDILKDPFLVIHEVVEVNEILKRGLKITKDVITKNYEKVMEAHLTAAEVELEISKKMGNYENIETKIRYIKGWEEDPLLTDELKEKCRNLYKKAHCLLR